MQIFELIFILILVFGPMIIWRVSLPMALLILFSIILNPILYFPFFIFETITGKKIEGDPIDICEGLICFTLLFFLSIGLVMNLCELVGTYLY